jgi:hypothetical protein
MVTFHLMVSLLRCVRRYFMDVAKQLKEALDKHTPGTCWHVVVGKQFGSFVTNERKKYVGGRAVVVEGSLPPSSSCLPSKVPAREGVRLCASQRDLMRALAAIAGTHVRVGCGVSLLFAGLVRLLCLSARASSSVPPTAG